MTILAVMRHAKSSWGDSNLADFDRPLNERGHKAARLIGQELKRRGFGFDQVIASPAKRVRETLAELAKGYGEMPDAHLEPQIYDASLEKLLALVRGIPGVIHAPLLVGHNPGLQQLVLELTSDDDSGLRAKVEEKFPTAAVALVELPAIRWDEVEPNSGTLRELILPRELD